MRTSLKRVARSMTAALPLIPRELLYSINDWRVTRDSLKYVPALHRLPVVEGEKRTMKICFNLVRGWIGPPSKLEALFAKGLEEYEHAEAVVLWDDGVLRHCDTRTSQEPRPQRSICRKCRRQAGLLLNRMKLKHRPYSELINPDVLASVEARILNQPLSSEDIRMRMPFPHDGIDISEYAHASTVRYYQTGLIPESAEAVQYYRDCLVNAAISIEVARSVLEQEKPDLIVTSHAIYTTWGAAYEYWRKNGQNVLVYGQSGAARGRVWFLRNNYIQNLWKEPLRAQQEAVATMLTRDQVRFVDSYLAARAEMREGDTEIYDMSPNHEASTDVHSDESPAEQYALFPNVPWDAAVIGRSSVFSSMIDWVVTTARYFKKHPEKRLFIRVHPSENTLMRSTATLEETLRVHYPDALDADNIRVISAGDPVSSYALARDVDVSLVFNGTLGLELASQGLPVIVAAKAHYAMVIEAPSTREEYFELLDEPRRVKQRAVEIREQALRYSYWYFCGFPVHIPHLGDRHWLDISLAEYWGNDERAAAAWEGLAPALRIIADAALENAR